MKSFKIIRVGPKSNDKYPIRGTDSRKKAMW